MATEKKGKAAGPATKGLKVVSRPASFRRGGQSFTGEARVVPLSDLTEEQAEQIKNDANLVVQEVDIEPPAEDKPAKK
ncbi:MAG: hypothetical protein Q8N06_06680 [Hydrogenophaga sp.]|nr:hypothetical protein [Hydrogenophaga sp.]